MEAERPRKLLLLISLLLLCSGCVTYWDAPDTGGWDIQELTPTAPFKQFMVETGEFLSWLFLGWWVFPAYGDGWNEATNWHWLFG